MAHRLAPQAEIELDEIWYYAATESGSVEIADRLIDRITECFFLLATHPHMGCQRDDLRSGAGLRSFPVGRFIIFYRITGEDVDILYVIPAARDIEPLL
jgi:toxin ParE1/3/4